MFQLVAALSSVAFCYAWLYFCATHGPRLIQGMLRWFDGEPEVKRRLVQALVSSATTLAGALLLGTVLGFLTPKYDATTQVDVFQDSEAQRAGLEDGDIIVSIDQQKIESFEQIKSAVASNQGTLQVEVLRKSKLQRFEVGPVQERLGVRSRMVSRRRHAMEALRLSSATFSAAAGSLLRPRAAVELSGPLGLVRESSRDEKGGSYWFVPLILLSSLWLIVPMIHFFDIVTLILQRGRARFSGDRDTFNLVVLGSVLVVLIAAGAALEARSGSPLLELATQACGFALSLACFTALKRVFSPLRAGIICFVGAFVGPILWLGTLFWLRRRSGVVRPAGQGENS